MANVTINVDDDKEVTIPKKGYYKKCLYRHKDMSYILRHLSEVHSLIAHQFPKINLVFSYFLLTFVLETKGKI